MHPEISKKIGGLPWHAGMENGRTWPRPSLSDLLAELESSNPQRISKKIGGTDIEAKALFLLLVEGILTRLSSLVV